MRSWLLQLRETWSALRALFPHIRGARWRLTIALVGLSLSTIMEGVGVGLMVPLISLLFNPGAEPMRPVAWLHRALPGHTPEYYVAVCASAVAAAIALKNLIALGTSALMARIQAATLVDLRGALFARLQQAPVDVFERYPAGELSNVFMREAQRSVDALAASLSVLQTLTMASFYVAGLFWLSVPLGVASLVLGALIGGAVAFVYRRLGTAGQEVVRSNAGLTARLLEAFGGVRVVRAANAQAYETERFMALNISNAAADETSMRGNAALPAIIETCAVIGAMLLVSGAYWALVVPGHMTTVHLSGFGLFLLRLTPLIQRFYGSQGILFYLAGGIREVGRWLATPAYPARPFGTRPIRRLEQGLSLCALGYRYPSGREALRDVSFQVPVGKMIAVVGRSGSGKTTLASLLLRLREPTAGAILVDGVDFWEIAPADWHRVVAIVEQDVFLFNDTLAANVAYGWPQATRTDVETAVRAAHLGDVAAALPEGLDTVLGERGLTLSGGQRQRLAIARALVRDPALLLLDEATSHLDTVSEQMVQRAIGEATRGRTTIVIAHRLSTVRRADWIIVLEEGHVAEQGDWRTLERAGGAFSALLRSDFRDEAELGEWRAERETVATR